MKFKTKFVATYLLITSVLSISCENDIDNQIVENNKIQQLNEIKIIDGTLHINNKESLIDMMHKYQKNDKYQNLFDKQILELQINGFRPLTPIFDNYTIEQKGDFLKKKIQRNNKRNLDFGLVNIQSRNEELINSLDDDIIMDPAFAALLNEDREIIVEDKLYRYTEVGLFVVDTDDEILLDNYWDSLTSFQRLNLLNNPNNIPTCNPGNQHLTQITADIDFYLSSPLPPCIPNWSSTNNSPAPIPWTTYAPPANLIKENLPICNVVSQGFFEGIFGVTEECSSFFSGDRAVSTRFWNQNFFIFSSIGTRVKYEKKECINFFWGGSICWWEKSYPWQIELGVNSVSYDYTYNVPMFNAQAYNWSTTFFTYNGTNYNSEGQVINSVPTGKGKFVFDTSSDNSVMNISILGYQLTNDNLNQAIDLVAKEFVNKLPPSSAAKSDIIDKMNRNKITYNVINAVPFTNKVKMITSNVRWNAIDAARLTHYFDFNFLFTWSSNSGSWGEYLSGLNGATSYTNVSADVYGAAMIYNQWLGNRMKYVK